MQQSYAGKDIVKFIAAILWGIMGIIYISYVFDGFDGLDQLKPYKQYGGEYYRQAAGILWVSIIIYAIAAIITFAAAVYMIKEDVNKFGTTMYVFATGYVITAIVLLIYLNNLSGGSLSASFRYLGSSLGKYLVVIGIAAILVVSSIYAEGINYKKADRGEVIGGKSFVPLGVYLSSLICILILSHMLKSDFGDYIDVSDVFGSALRSQSGGGIALIIGIHIACGLYIFLREKHFVGGYGAYGSMGYGMSPYGSTGYGVPPYGATGYGMPPYGSTGYGVPPYGATGYGVPPYGQTAYGQPGGMGPGMVPLGMIPPVKSKLELAKEQSDREFVLKKGGWICYNCKTANYSYVGSCACGMTRDESEKREKEDKDRAVAEMNERLAKSKGNDVSDSQDDSDENAYGKEVKAGSVLEASSLKREKKTWECLACYTINDEDAKSCKNCGQIKAMGYKNVKVLYCPSCGTMLEEGSKFCYLCGAKI
ncbi:MAG: zinc-ribbon domain-containing protein [Lachnospiraceae bacterium]|nr:zinc-ribbon domain-containing protein [Lachnospiraceae bacterium]